MSKTFPADMDPACVPACAALCALPGVETTSSCEGHGRRPPSIELRVASLAALHPIARAIDPRYYGVDPAWELRVEETDLVDDRLRFVLQTSSTPRDAAAALEYLARSIADAAEQIVQWEVARGRAARLRISIFGDRRREVSEVREVVVLPGVAVCVADVDSGRLGFANLGAVTIYLGLPDVRRGDAGAVHLAPGSRLEFSSPPTWPLYAIAEDPPPRVEPVVEDDDAAGDLREPGECVE